MIIYDCFQANFTTEPTTDTMPTVARRQSVQGEILRPRLTHPDHLDRLRVLLTRQGHLTLLGRRAEELPRCRT